jgi:glycosyltransferase involved in cell wall biosynthesis
MLNQKRVCVVLPAYNAAETIEMTYKEIPFDIVDDVVLVDDASKDGIWWKPKIVLSKSAFS